MTAEIEPFSGTPSPNFATKQFVVIDAAAVTVVSGLDALIDEVKSFLWDGEDAPPEDVLALLDVVGNPNADEWCENGEPRHLHYEFEDGWFSVWIVDRVSDPERKASNAATEGK